jgi:hypothetical protein
VVEMINELNKAIEEYRTKWLSIWFAGTEAKLRTDTVLQVCTDELLETQTNLLKS